VMDGKTRLSPPQALEGAKQAQKEGRFYLEEKS
jgi:hypothetical protein